MEVAQRKNEQDFWNFEMRRIFCSGLLFHKGNFLNELIFLSRFDFHPNPVFIRSAYVFPDCKRLTALGRTLVNNVKV